MGLLDGFAVTGRKFTKGFVGSDIDTVSYPEEKRAKALRLHGRHVLNRYEDGMEKCIGCELCAGVCPASCIYVRGKDNDPNDPVSPGERYGFAVQAPGEDAVWGIRFTDRKPLRNWMDLTTADKDLGWRWAIELMKRGLLVNPNEKFYISIAHTDEDVDRTLQIVDDAFAALKKQG